MLDIKLLRSDFEGVEKALSTRNEEFDLSKFMDLDAKRRALLGEVEALKSEQNKASKQVPIMKKEGKDTTALFEEMKQLSDKIKDLDAQVRTVDEELDAWMLTIPNIPHPSVPAGKSDEENVEIRKFGEPTKFDFEAKAHWDIGKDLDILDPEMGAKTSGARFTFYKGLGAKLERAIMNFFLDVHEKQGYEEVFPPFMAVSYTHLTLPTTSRV